MSYKSVNPATNVLIKSWPEYTDSEMEALVASSSTLFHSDWCRGDIRPRLQILSSIADLMDSRIDELATTASAEMGKLINQSRDEVKLCAQIARYYAENAERFLAPVPHPTQSGQAWVEHHPIGVVLAIEPWNFPYYQLMRVLAPNLAAGNPVLAKHAPNVPHCAALFAELVHESGAPEGAWGNLYISNDQVSKLLADTRIQGVSLTGSEQAGSAVAAQAGKHLKKTIMELGGNDVFVVLDDCELELATKIGSASRLNNCGQVCIAAKRFLVHERVADAFLEKLQYAFSQVHPGDPLDEQTTLGPLSSIAARERLEKQVTEAVDHGAKLLMGGQAIAGPGCFYKPTILTNITRDNPAWYQEFFGPVAQVYTVKDDDEAVMIANDSHYGLGGSIFSTNIARARKLAARIETGMVFINSACNSAPELPFGGIKRSGYGRELSDLGIKEFINQKLVVISDD